MSVRTYFGALFLPTVLIVLVLGPPLWLDSAAPAADAVVTRKYEGYRLNRDPDGGWRRRLSVWTELRTAAGAVHNSELMLGVADYDRLSVGSRLRVRYLPVYPYTTRPVARTTLVQARELLTPRTTRDYWFALLVIFGPLTIIAARLTKIVGLTVGAVWLGASWVYVLRPVPLPVPGPIHSTARVSWTEVQTRGIGRRRHDRLGTPYRLVALSFVPPGARDSIEVLDAVDSTSLQKPTNGSLEPIGYEPAAPRTARLLVGTRTFINANRYEYYIVGIAPIAFALLFGIAWKRRRAKRKLDRAGVPNPQNGYRAPRRAPASQRR
jgi:hypothetical protein